MNDTEISPHYTDPTEKQHNAAPFEQGQAYSDIQVYPPTGEVNVAQNPTSKVGIVVSMVAVALMAVLWLGMGYMIGHKTTHQAAPIIKTITNTVTETVQPTQPPMPPMTPDQFHASLQSVGIPDPDFGQSEEDARHVCELLNQGEGFNAVTDWIAAKHPEFNDLQVGGFEGNAAALYCPQHRPFIVHP